MEYRAVQVRRRRIVARAASPRSSCRADCSWMLLGFAFAALACTGCQVDVGGQTLPSAYYLQDDIQYFPAGPEFKLAKEAAALKAYEEELGETCETCH